jgi:hypothetical protein
MYNYYFIHGSSSFTSLCKILKDGKIKPSRLLQNKNSIFSGKEKKDHIYTNIYFTDIQNIENMLDFSLLIKNNVVEKNKNMEFHEGWNLNVGLQIIMKNYEDFKKNLKKIRQLLKNPKKTTPSGILCHEFLFHKPISVRKYVFAIYCDPSNDINKLQKIIDDKKYNIIIYTKNSPMPHL